MGRRWHSVAIMALALWLMALTPALADGPTWDKTRQLDCGEAGVLQAVLPPAGFGAAFHLVDGTGVIVPVWVEVRFPDSDEWIVTFDKPGPQRTNVRKVDCRYTDPAGIDVHLIGLITPAKG